MIETNREAATFYERALRVLEETGVPYLVGGAYAMQTYAGIVRETKDLDVFCKAGDHPRLLRALAEAGYRTEITDATWLAKAFEGDYFVDIIFGSANGVSTVDDSWFEHAYPAEVVGTSVRIVSAEDQIWQKCFVQDRFRHDGADVVHIIRKWGLNIDWTRLLNRMEAHWELLFAHILQFRYVYPGERSTIPTWLMEELQSRVSAQMSVPVPTEAVCRGPLLSIRQTVEGEPLEIYPFLGSSRLANPIDRYGVTVAVHGHAHHGAHSGNTTTGVPVYNVSYALMHSMNAAQPYLVLNL